MKNLTAALFGLGIGLALVGCGGPPTPPTGDPSPKGMPAADNPPPQVVPTAQDKETGKSSAKSTENGKESAAPRTKSSPPLRLPPEGYKLPAEAKLLRERYDLNKDGVLSQEEYDAIPPPLRGQIDERIRTQTGPLRLPPGGYKLPPAASLLRSQYDTNKDGVLSQDELDAIPAAARPQIEDRIRQSIAGGGRTGRSGPPATAKGKTDDRATKKD